MRIERAIEVAKELVTISRGFVTTGARWPLSVVKVFTCEPGAGAVGGHHPEMISGAST